MDNDFKAPFRIQRNAKANRELYTRYGKEAGWINEFLIKPNDFDSRDDAYGRLGRHLVGARSGKLDYRIVDAGGKVVYETHTRIPRAEYRLEFSAVLNRRRGGGWITTSWMGDRPDTEPLKVVFDDRHEAVGAAREFHRSDHGAARRLDFRVVDANGTVFEVVKPEDSPVEPEVKYAAGRAVAAPATVEGDALLDVRFGAGINLAFADNVRDEVRAPDNRVRVPDAIGAEPLLFRWRSEAAREIADMLYEAADDLDDYNATK